VLYFLAVFLVISALGAMPPAASASTSIACDWAGKIADAPQTRRVYPVGGGEVTEIDFNMKVSRSAKSRNYRSDSSCPVPADLIGVHLVNVPFDHRRGDTVRVRSLYMDDAMLRGKSWFEPIDCRKERSPVC
jgi:hypothetical protein